MVFYYILKSKIKNWGSFFLFFEKYQINENEEKKWVDTSNDKNDKFEKSANSLYEKWTKSDVYIFKGLLTKNQISFKISSRSMMS